MWSKAASGGESPRSVTREGLQLVIGSSINAACRHVSNDKGYSHMTEVLTRQSHGNEKMKGHFLLINFISF